VRVVVTGGAGFIGANLCRRLAVQPGIDRVTAYDDLSTGRADNLVGCDVELVRDSILDLNALDRVVRGADAVVHLAARPSVPRSVAEPLAAHAINATGTMFLLEVCRRHGVRVVAASSSSVYGDTIRLPKDEDHPTRPRSPYAASKLASEAYVLAYGASYGLPTLALRFFNVYGPMQPAGHAYAAVVPAFVDAALRGEPLTVHGDGRQTRDFTYVGTVAEALTEAVLRGRHSPSPINLAFGGRTSVLELIEMLEDVLGQPLAREFLPGRTGDVRDSRASDGRVRALLPGIEPVPLRAGLEQTVEWHRRRRPAPAVTTVVKDSTGPRR
jgi:UDP-glucose 4-epimerase